MMNRYSGFLPFRWILVFVCLLGIFPACVSDQQEDSPQEEVDADGEEKSAEAAAEEGEENEGDNAASQGLGLNDESPAGEASDLAALNPLEDPAGSKDNAVLAGGGSLDAGQSNTFAAPPIVSPSDASGRVVRYVVSDKTPVYDKPDAGGAAIAQLEQGDPVVVALQGEWAEILPGRYVMMSALAEKAVPRLYAPNPWSPSKANQPANSFAGP